MKKFVSTLLACAMTFSCAALAVGCGDDKKEGDDANTQTPATTETLTKADYAEALESVSSSCAAYIKAPAAQAAATSLTFEESDFIELNDPSRAKRMAQSALWLVLFMRNVCQNEDYDVTDATEDSIAMDGTYTYDIRFSLAYDADTENINVCISADYENNPTLMYLVVDVQYDFDASTLNEFSIYGFIGSKDSKTEDGVAYFKWKGMNAQQLSTEAEGYSAFAQGIIADMDAMWLPEKSENPYDFSKEYVDAGTEMQEIMGA